MVEVRQPSNGRPRVVIVGAGFGGLSAARGLADAPVDAIVIDRFNYRLFQPLLYQVATAGLSSADIAAPILSDAIALRRRIMPAFEKAEIESDPLECERLLSLVLVGGGPTGVEMAGAPMAVSRKRNAYDQSESAEDDLNEFQERPPSISRTSPSEHPSEARVLREVVARGGLFRERSDVLD